MGLFGLTSEVLTEFRIDATDAKAELRELKDLQTQLGAEEGAAAAERNVSLQSWIEGLGKVTLALVAVKEVGEVIWDGYKEGIADARNATAAYGVDIERLSEAAHGLVTEHELLAFAAKASNGAFKNSQEDLENAQKAMIALERRGYDAAQAQQAITDALVSGRVRGLEPMGVIIDKHVKDLGDMADANMTLAQKEELHARALQTIASLAGTVADGEDAVGESMGRTVTGLKNSWDELKKSTGQLAVAMQPLIEALAILVKLSADIINQAASSPGDLWGALKNTYHDYKDGGEASSFYTKTNMFGAGGLGKIHSIAAQSDVADAERHKYDGEIQMTPEEVTKWEEAQKKIAAAIKKDEAEWAKLNETLVRGRVEQQKHDAEYVKAHLHDIHNDDGTLLGIASSGPNADIAAAMKKLTRDQSTQMTKDWQKQTAAYDKKKDTFLEKTFGKVGDFDIYKEAFASLEGAVSSSMKAWIDGSMSAGQAFKKFIGDALGGLASQMLIESLKHTAYALGSLAFGDARGAALHAVAAVEFGVGAAAAGIAAKELGGGGATASGGGASSHGSASGGVSAGGGTSGSGGGPMIVYGDSFSEDSPRMRRVKAERMWARATGTSYARNQ